MLSRPTHPMPDEVRVRLLAEGLMADFEARPPYQRNDYLGWIGGAKQQATRDRRTDQMVDELRLGGVYMNMSHPASAKP